MFDSSNDFPPLINQVYYAGEEADCMAHCCCGPNRSFQLIVTDTRNRQVMQFSRPTAFGFSDSIDVSAPVGRIIGRVVKQFDLVFPMFKIKDYQNKTVLNIEGPAITTSFFGDVEFKVRLER